jgi:hypothetical protein
MRRRDAASRDAKNDCFQDPGHRALHGFGEARCKVVPSNFRDRCVEATCACGAERALMLATTWTLAWRGIEAIHKPFNYLPTLLLYSVLPHKKILKLLWLKDLI